MYAIRSYYVGRNLHLQRNPVVPGLRIKHPQFGQPGRVPNGPDRRNRDEAQSPCSPIDIDSVEQLDHLGKSEQQNDANSYNFV